ncbi:DNA polymerase III subunit alpha [Corallococcus macrosporus]|uniref:DNA-directed DNA polymerase n=1 Tax=Corallococcus macrosporus DSM 14697 TaxID=1189310 RepID=A0A250JX76_9BACT|nr:error-prone DNA polymerase [Corallococcus macrosporus]ATB48268.1 DNA polymerase [Corallococcus macrosporus DSM 14697]
MGYAELVCRSNFSFLRGASHPEELVATAARLGLGALALTDADGLYGAVKAHLAAKEHGVRLILGAELTLEDGPPVVVYAADGAGYSNLCALVSQSRMTHPKGEAGLPWRAVADRSAGLLALLPEPAPFEQVVSLAEAFPERFHVGVCRTLSAGDAAREARAERLALALGVPLVAHNDVHTHHRRRQPLQDVLVSIRHGTSVDRAGTRLLPNAERTLKSPRDMARLFADRPEALERAAELASRCHASLDDLHYRFPEEDLPEGRTADAHLRALTCEGLRFRYPEGVPPAVVKQIEHELRLIAALDFAGYFLALWDIVRFARAQGILCQGRGSAANSAVCYALQITAIDPVRMGLLFERFLSMERKEPPDIDVDFEHERREEVLQYVYEKHGRRHAGMVCEVICFRGRLALRETGKALGLSLDQVDRLSKVAASNGFDVTPDVLREAGLSAEDGRVQKTLALAMELEGFPRHLSIHVGGFVMTREPLTELVPVENAAMPGRTVIQWEKDDINAVGLLKVDLLALGMLTALSKCFALIREHHGRELSLATVPAEDPKVYDMLCEADTVGVFQIESRAQMNMLPRLKPRTFYDLVVEIALIRPGPIVGNMVHPFLRRRSGQEQVVYPSEAVKEILGKTLGVPLFQEQAMKLAMVAAGFTAGEADGLRRVLSHKRAESMLLRYRGRFVEGCVSRGYARQQAEEWFDNFRGFAHYGFPESHSASFALIAYASSWLKCHYPAAFTAALLNSQPMGFYAPHTLVADAQRHGVEVRPVDVRRSSWDCTLEEGGAALRLGLRMVKGLGESAGRRVAAARSEGLRDVGDLARRSRAPRHELTRLALAGALSSLCGSRRQALWELQALGPLDADDLFFGMAMDGTAVELPSMDVLERVCADYDTVGLSLEKHPLELLRPVLRKQGAVTAEGLKRVAHGRKVSVGGMLICRQRPPTAKGICFISLEDETGIANLVVPAEVYERCRKDIHGALFLVGEGVLERSGKVTNVKSFRVASLHGGRATLPGT